MIALEINLRVMPACALCGALFSPPRSNQKYCSRECYAETNRRNAKVIAALMRQNEFRFSLPGDRGARPLQSCPRTLRTCPRCRITFGPLHHLRLYCSRKCGDDVNRERATATTVRRQRDERRFSLPGDGGWAPHATRGRR